jgi:hypothetical protein
LLLTSVIKLFNYFPPSSSPPFPIASALLTYLLATMFVAPGDDNATCSATATAVAVDDD